uniref:Uncharacterized protein n=1 Tax=Anguilla anguilla TaxID=7936 RepID=A0A0E9SS77_ANGAN
MNKIYTPVGLYKIQVTHTYPQQSIIQSIFYSTMISDDSLICN